MTLKRIHEKVDAMAVLATNYGGNKLLHVNSIRSGCRNQTERKVGYIKDVKKCPHTVKISAHVNVHGSVHPTNILIYLQKDAT